MLSTTVLTLLLATSAAPVTAQQTEEAPADLPEAQHEIVVTAPQLKGTVIGNFPPDVDIGEAEIGTYGAGSLAELVEAVAPVTGSSRGRGQGGPVILIDGRRTSGFSEIRTIPPEAIQRFQVLPEEAAIAYGYRPEQRVINIILRKGFRSISGEGRVRSATEGGRSEQRGSASLFRNGDLGRLTVDLEYEHQTPLLESERDIPAGTPDARAYRTLLPQVDSAALNAALSRTLFDTVSATFNGKVDWRETNSRLGLSSASPAVPLAGTTQTVNAHLGTAFNGGTAPWRWSLTANYDHGDVRSRTDSATVPHSPTRTSSLTDSGAADLVVTGALFELPAGKLQSTFKAGGALTAITSRATRAGTSSQTDLSRKQGNVQASLMIPLTSRRDNVLAAIGDVAINLNAGVSDLSDFGAIHSLDYGLSWEPLDLFRLAVSVSDEDGAPGISQLGAPTVVTPNVRVYDFLRGETVDVARTEGGNPALLADNRHAFSLTGTLRPPGKQNLTFTMAYNRSTTRDPVSNLSTATQALALAFPERFTRDASGRLVAVDARPLNLAQAKTEELRTSLFLSFPFGKAKAPPPGAARGGMFPAGGPMAGGGRPAGGGAGGGRPGGFQGGGSGGGFTGGGGGGGFMPLQPGQGRVMLSVEHRWRFVDKVLLREGQGWLDLLDGQTVTGRGGQPRHELTARFNLMKDGIGSELSGTWKAATRVRGNGTPASPDLVFADLATLDARLFIDFDRRPAMLKAAPLLKGARLGFSVENLFAARQKVQDAAGHVPAGYEPDYLDPAGRMVRLFFRKLF